MVFILLFWLGVAGLGLMTLMGFIHVGHIGGSGSHGIGHGHAGGGLRGSGHASVGAHGHVHASHGAHPTVSSNGTRTTDLLPSAHVAPVAHHGGRAWYTFIPSPIDLFSLCVGAGLTGMICQSFLQLWPLYLAVSAGSLFFTFAIIRPFIGLILRFASKPSEGMEGAIALNAEAITRFDEHGRGLVRVCMEGQLVQLLATLSQPELASGVEVHKGDQVVITEVNANANTCLVTRELSI